MKIAFFSDNFFPELSGITDTILTTTKELKSRGHEVIYCAPHYAPQDWQLASRQYPQKPEDDTVNGSRIVRIPAMRAPLSPTGQSRMAYPWGVVPQEILDFKPDIIHVHSPYGAGLMAARAARLLRVPLVGTNHTAIEDFFPLGTQEAMRMWDAHYYNNCDFMSAPYARLIERMREMGFKKPGHAVSNPADLQEFRPPTAKERVEHREAFGVGNPVIVYAGRLGVEKRVDVMVRALPFLVQEFPTVTLLMTGHGAARPALERLVQQLGMGAHARFAGYLSRKALPHAYQAADMFGMTSTSDSQSLALMQAYATGLPAVLARSRGLPDYAPAECSYLIEPGNAQEFAQKAALLLRDNALREQMGLAAVEYVKRFAPDLIAAQWEHIYSDTLAAPRQNALRTEVVKK